MRRRGARVSRRSATGPPSHRPNTQSHAPTGERQRIIGTYKMRPSMDLSHALISRRRRRSDLGTIRLIDLTACAREIYEMYGREKRCVPEHRAQPMHTVLLRRAEKRAQPSFPPLRKSTLAMAFDGVPRRVSPAKGKDRKGRHFAEHENSCTKAKKSRFLSLQACLLSRRFDAGLAGSPQGFLPGAS